MVWNFKKKKQDYPEFWETYEGHFEHQEKKNLETSRFVVFDTETTGFDFDVDRILSIGAVTVIGNEIDIKDTFEIYLKQAHYNPHTAHIHGILKNTKHKNSSEEENAIKQFLEYIKDAVLVGHHANFDVQMINKALKRMGVPNLKNKVIDTMHLYADTRIKSNFIDARARYSLDDIAEAYMLELTDRHTAPGDALITALIFLKTTALLKQKKNFKLESYFLKSNRF